MALRFLTTFRVPPKVHERMVSGEILRRAIERVQERREKEEAEAAAAVAAEEAAASEALAQGVG